VSARFPGPTFRRTALVDGVVRLSRRLGKNDSYYARRPEEPIAHSWIRVRARAGLLGSWSVVPSCIAGVSVIPALPSREAVSGWLRVMVLRSEAAAFRAIWPCAAGV